MVDVIDLPLERSEVGVSINIASPKEIIFGNRYVGPTNVVRLISLDSVTELRCRRSM